MSDRWFSVGPRTQSIPKFAFDGLGSRWFYLRLFSVNPLKNKTDIVAVYRQIILQTFDKNLNWVNQFAYSEDYEVYRNGKFRNADGRPGVITNSLEDAYSEAAKRYGKLSGIWPILEDNVAIEYLTIPTQ